MNVEFITKTDLQEFKKEFLNEIRSLVKPSDLTSKAWLKTNEVRKILKCSHGTVQNLRINGKLKPSKVGGTWYYEAEQVMSLLNH